MKNFNQNPVCSFISVIIITIFSLYFTNAIKTIPCKKDMQSVFVSQFIHVDFFHLLSNLYGLYSLSRVEQKYGPKFFFSLIFFLLVTNAIIESILHKIIVSPCSIGFSGILYGVFTFELVSKGVNVDYLLFISIIANMIANDIFKNNVSLQGHLVGALTGIISGILFKKIF
jgi:membrane associated rhomboid family serine protease